MVILVEKYGIVVVSIIKLQVYRVFSNGYHLIRARNKSIKATNQ